MYYDGTFSVVMEKSHAVKVGTLPSKAIRGLNSEAHKMLENSFHYAFKRSSLLKAHQTENQYAEKVAKTVESGLRSIESQESKIKVV